MSQKITQIAKNTSYFTLALILQKVISFTYFAILARNLMPEDLGKYYFAISFTTIFAIFIDLGLSNVLVREVAKTKDKAGQLLATVLAVKIPLAALSLAVVAILINLMGYPELTRYLVYISSISMILDSFSLTFYAVIRGHHTLFFESIGSIMFQLIVLIFGLTALKSGWGLTWVIGAQALASLVNFSYSLAILRLRLKIRLRPRWDTALIRAITVLTVPFGLYAVFQRLYMYLDTVLLSAIAGDYHVGLYQIAFKIVFALQFLPMAFVASLYPAFASYWKATQKASKTLLSRNDRSVLDAPTSQIVVTFERAINYLLIISLPITIGIMVLSDKIIHIFKPEYMAAVLPLQIIIASVPFIFLNFPVGSLLNACDRQKRNTVNMAIALFASIIMNIILIPRFQAVGASITVFSTNLLLFVIGMLAVPDILSYRPPKIIAIAWRVLISVLAMAVTIALLKARFNIIFLVLAGAIIYLLAMFILGGIKREDVASILGSFTNKRI